MGVRMVNDCPGSRCRDRYDLYHPYICPVRAIHDQCVWKTIESILSLFSFFQVNIIEGFFIPSSIRENIESLIVDAFEAIVSAVVHLVIVGQVVRLCPRSPFWLHFGQMLQILSN